MLVTNPRRINHEQLRILARNAKGDITHIYLHWTAGTYEQVFDDYHINIGEQGELYLTCNMLREYKSHTWRRNSRSIGVTLCCAKDAILAYKCNPVFDAYPPTELQVEQMAIVVAILCHELELEINNDTVLTHAEAASRDQYCPGQGDPDMRWDLYMLKGMPETRALPREACCCVKRLWRICTVCSGTSCCNRMKWKWSSLSCWRRKGLAEPLCCLTFYLLTQPFRLLAKARSHLPFQGRYNSMCSSNYRCYCQLLYAP